ncbi:MAG: phenylalanine--tRNA ligase subunit beta [Neisseriales bacterium]|nr:MAG: phenylalanine--tRNA ligase subunit beta [Neisseriales bacterium]
MQILESWLRHWVDPPLSIEDLAELLTVSGIEVEAIYPSGKTDHIFLFKITPNRGDCLSIKGLAREVSALTNTPWHPSCVIPATITYHRAPAVHIHEPSACCFYTGRLIRHIDLINGCVPQLITDRLVASGLVPTSTVVDIANYVMLELGQPLHIFDAKKIDGAIQVRMAKMGEVLHCLNDQLITLDATMLVIADDKKPLSLAGIMGSMESALTSTTQDLFLESAYFQPNVVANKARSLGIVSEAAYRFERGIDSTAQQEALERVTQLIVESFGGQVGSIVQKQGDSLCDQFIDLHTKRVEQLLGIHIPDEKIATILARLMLNFTRQTGHFTVSKPSFRNDLMIEEDLVEEIARLYGYDNIPALSPSAPLHVVLQPKAVVQSRFLRQVLVARGYQEVIHYPFVSEALEKNFSFQTSLVRLLNPIDSQATMMRSTLLGTLVERLIYYMDRQHTRVRCFEIANIFSGINQQAEQKAYIGLLAWGARYPEQWGYAESRVDFYDVKADIEALFAPRKAEFEPIEHLALHQGRAANILLDRQVIGVIGELSPQLTQQYHLLSAPILSEFSIEVLYEQCLASYRTTSKFPMVKRDLALIVDKTCSAKQLYDALYCHAPHIVKSIELFDVYSGSGIPLGKKSMAYHVLLQAMDKTLVDDEINAAMDQLLDAVSTIGATLRT